LCYNSPMNIYDVNTYDYEYPQELVAQKPLADRAASKLLVLERYSGKITHDVFRNIGKHLLPGDCMVMNDTKVIPARLYGVKESTGAKIEILLEARSGDNWIVMMKNSRRVKEGEEVAFPEGIRAQVIKKQGKTVEVKFNFKDMELMSKIWKAGVMPLPPYITENPESKEHNERYQTVYAASEGAKAAPTAGLHFTRELIEKLEAKSIKTTRITLHAGMGTFEPVTESDMRSHNMHSENFEIPHEAATMINSAKKFGRVIAVGTTSLRALESAVKNDRVYYGSGTTDLYILPGYNFKVADALITNFHLPKTTLMALVCAFAGVENIKNAYEEAIRKKYRLFSYGDAMLIK
jgi:S-adenosylmethionine:tRNA ribosyltransferase-isomerase